MTLPAVAAQRGIDEYTWSALQNSVFPGARAESIALAVDYCKARKLDVMKKPCHIVPMYVKDQQTGQSSWRVRTTNDGVQNRTNGRAGRSCVWPPY